MCASLNEPITITIQQFYNRIAFNCSQSLTAECKHIKANQLRFYPDLNNLLINRSIARVLDVGCGMGWLANTIAYHYRKSVTGIDIAEIPLRRARAIAERLGIAQYVSYDQKDLFDYARHNEFELIVSIGVLHH